MLADQNHFNMSPANFRMSPSLVLGNNVWPKSLSKQKPLNSGSWEKNISGKRKNLHPIAPWMGKFMGVSHIQSRGIWVWICLSPARPKPLPPNTNTSFTSFHLESCIPAPKHPVIPKFPTPLLLLPVSKGNISSIFTSWNLDAFRFVGETCVE